MWWTSTCPVSWQISQVSARSPCEQLLVRVVDPDRLRVKDRRRCPPVEWYLAEPCDQWLSAVAFDSCLEAGPHPVRCHDLGLMPGRHTVAAARTDWKSMTAEVGVAVDLDQPNLSPQGI